MPEAVNIFKAVSDPSRLRILKMLEVRDLCVCEITQALGLSTSTVSKHLNILRSAELIWDERDGKWVNYGLNRTSGHPLTAEILKFVREKINDDPVYQEDREKIRSTSREMICGIKT